MRKMTAWQRGGLAALVLVAMGVTGYLVSGGDGSHDQLALGTNDGGFDEAGPRDGLERAMPGSAPAAMESAQDADAPSLRDGSGGEPAPGGVLASAIDRKIVHTASLQLQVEEVGVGFEEAGRIATAAGGFVASSSVSYQDERQIASVTVRVPTERYQAVLSQLRALGVRVDSEQSEASDVTEEYTDLASRLRNLEATEMQLLSLLDRAESISDIMTVQDRLNQVRHDIEQVQGRIQMLDNMAELATITVHLRPVMDEGATVSQNGTTVDLRAEVSEAWEASLRFLGGIAAGAIMVVVFAWWVPVVALPVLVVVRLMTRNRPSALEAVD